MSKCQSRCGPFGALRSFSPLKYQDDYEVLIRLLTVVDCWSCKMTVEKISPPVVFVSLIFPSHHHQFVTVCLLLVFGDVPETKIRQTYYLKKKNGKNTSSSHQHRVLDKPLHRMEKISLGHVSKSHQEIPPSGKSHSFPKRISAFSRTSQGSSLSQSFV